MAYTTIDKPTDYFSADLWSGNSSTQSINVGKNFSSNGSLIWIKGRNGTNRSHRLIDSVRGKENLLASNSLDPQFTESGDGIASYSSTGFNLQFSSQNDYNESGGNYVGWNWLAGTTGSGTTTGAGTGKAYSYSVNTTSGFSIVKYLGNGTAGHTIPHHLGAVPKMIILKRDAATNWSTYHVGMGNGKSIPLNEAEAPTTSTSFWNDTTPTSSVFTVGSISNTNSNDSSIIAYCFAEKQGYSKFSSYVGNGNVDGTFCYTGFKVGWLMIKKSSATGSGWMIFDTKRNPTNAGATLRLPANTSSSESTDHILDMLSNGFKIRDSDATLNTSGATFIYMAFASNPLVTSTGVPATAR